MLVKSLIKLGTIFFFVEKTGYIYKRCKICVQIFNISLVRVKLKLDPISKIWSSNLVDRRKRG